MSEPGPGTGERPLERAPFRAWLVTGPIGRLAGFVLDFSRAVRAHRRAAKEHK